MADDNSELLAIMGDVLRAIDRQTEENKQQITELREEFVSAFNNFATAIVDGFIRVEGKIDAVKQEVVGVKQEVAELRTDVDGLKQEVAGVKQEIVELKQEVTELKQEVTEVKQTVQRIDQRLEKVEANQSVTEDVVRRLTILENIVLNKAS
ncbi:hypothetical protein [Hymenobacter cavernae]|uniref:Uncharacterized protein n=1 Tax=Hymenobacter cavernae TaxID=2044852 RepID=A0ABQ1UCY2_9BACT|nr:hypothetical protein [Hymenobacter cavernae]GGF13982.1 hypothetical protein GCM10011383_26520 [Hymenobacter cavernae]